MSKKITCTQLLNYIPDKLLESLEEETEVNKQTKKLTGKLFFKLILFSLLNTERLSLRVMETFYQSDQFKAFSGRDNKNIKHSGIGERLSKINSDFFQKIFEHLTEKFSFLFKSKKEKKNFDLTKLDSTMVGLSSKLLKIGIDNRGTSGKMKWKQIKYSVSIGEELPKDVRIFDKQENISEEISLKKLISESKEKDTTIMVFDRGLQSRKTWREFSDAGISFVTRGRKNIAYKQIRKNKEIKGRKTKTLKLEKDLIVNIGSGSSRIVKQEFRLIIGKSLKTGEEISFLTNIKDLNAREITDIYKERWTIEMFFRFIKQELNFKHFVSRSLNGIKVMVYMTLIASLLLLVYKKKNKIFGYKIAKLKFALELEMDILKEITLTYGISWIENIKTPVPS